MSVVILTLWAVLAPLCSGLWVGFGPVSRVAAHRWTCAAVGSACLASWCVLGRVVGAAEPVVSQVFVWAHVNGSAFHMGVWLDTLSALMMCVVTSVSLCVHVYTIGYMADDPGYRRFFATIAFFTCAMLILVVSDNLLQLFVGWEAVGLASYLLIGFWHHKASAVSANLKAFLVNRVGDLGLLLGIAWVYQITGSLDYAPVLAHIQTWPVEAERVAHASLHAPTWIALCLWMGAMGKSAQVPLHVWLPDSMEGPTPISALIHAATMVTAGVFLLARFAALYECTWWARSVVLCVGSVTAFSMGWVALVQHDIKRVIAYSTLSQLGYMMAAAGASAYRVAVFHLVTHAFFKALLFLGAGAVIVGMHHEQDMRCMGGLRARMPWVYASVLIGALALMGVPFLSGFYSKDFILESVAHASAGGARWAALLLEASVAVTACYTVRLVCLVFHGTPRWRTQAVHPVPWVMVWPLVVLSVPAVGLGMVGVPWLSDPSFWGHSVSGLPVPAASVWEMGWHAWRHAPVWWATLGGVGAWLCYVWRPSWPDRVARACGGVYRILVAQYGVDAWYQRVLVRSVQRAGDALWQRVDGKWIDQGLVHGLSGAVGRLARWVRGYHTGDVSHYAAWMLAGLVLLGWMGVRG